MNALNWVLALSLAIGLLGGCGTTEKSMQEKGLSRLQTAELIAVLTSGELSFRSTSGNVSTVEFKRDESAVVNWGSGGDTGVWFMKGETFCVKWKELHNGEERCFHAYRTGEKHYSTFGPDGVMTGVFTAKR